ncbi:MAG: GWxTD domain-containing protein [Ignavibacteria bacterium]|nr:GWxTD domain-containing protein [Ignavibacteria bacterium]
MNIGMKKIFIVIILLFSIIDLPLIAQQMLQGEELGLPKFTFTTLSFASDTSALTKLKVYVQVEYSGLKFIKSEQGFFASYEVQISFFDVRNSLLYEKQWGEELYLQSYEQTTSTTSFAMHTHSFLFRPEEYIISVQVRDVETRKLFRMQKSVHVQEFGESAFEISDIMLMRGRDETNEPLPNISQILERETNEQKLYYEVYAKNESQNAKFMVRIFTRQMEELFCDTMSTTLAKGRNTIVFNFKKLELPVGEDSLELISKIQTDSTYELPKRTMAIRTRWKGIPANISIIDEAISQMVYISTSEEMDSLQEKAISDDERRQRFEQFWKRRDPTPQTERNELLEEYFSRVTYANKQYAVQGSGWRSDRGMVYIIFGNPDNIERHPFDIEIKPYEIWSYYDQNRRFTFVDETGFGDYRLVTPLWEVWGKGKR